MSNPGQNCMHVPSLGDALAFALALALAHLPILTPACFRAHLFLLNTLLHAHNLHAHVAIVAGGTGWATRSGQQ